MRFRARGTFETETVIAIGERLVAALQDAGAERVAGVSVYLTVVDRHGDPCPLAEDGRPVESLDLDVAELALDVPAARLEVARPQPAGRSVAARSGQRRRRS